LEKLIEIKISEQASQVIMQALMSQPYGLVKDLIVDIDSQLKKYFIEKIEKENK